MRSTEIGAKMREAFETTLPSDPAIVGRYDLARLRTAPREMQRRRAGAIGAGVLLAAAGVLFVWFLSRHDSVRIGPSLQRDLEARRDPGQTDSAREPVRALPPSLAGEAPGRLAPKPDLPSPASTDVPPGRDSAPIESQWALVTDAMRQRDWPAAQEALAPLLASSDRETRDSARLVRVRLELGAASNQESKAALMVELEELIEAGSTASIRASARRLHKSLVDGLVDGLADEGAKHPLPEGELTGQEGQ